MWRHLVKTTEVTVGWWKVMAAYRRVDGLKSPAGWQPVHRDQLPAQRLVTSMDNFTFFKYTQ